MTRSPTLRNATLASLASAAVALAASADMVPITDNTAASTEGLGRFTGTVAYTFLGGSSGRLDVSLTNTTDASLGGYITAFMFRTQPSAGTVTSMLSTWDNNLDTNIPAGTSGSPWNATGSWIGGAGLTSSWLAGGSPEDGIGVGQTGNWSFAITSVNASMLTAVSFVANTINTDTYAFIVRMRGMTLPSGADGSDKIPARDLPAPGAAALIGLAGILTRRRTA